MATLAAGTELELNVRDTAMAYLRACQPITMNDLVHELKDQCVGIDENNALLWATWFVIIGQQDGLIYVDTETNAIDLTDKGWAA